MAGVSGEAKGDGEFEFDLDLDDLDDETLQKLLDEDPNLEEELRALEAAERQHDEAADEEVSSPPVTDDLPPAVTPDDQPPASVEDDRVDALDDFDFASSAAMQSGPPPAVREQEEGNIAPEPTSTASPPAPMGDSFMQGVPPGPLPEETDTTALNIAPIPRINVHVFTQNEATTLIVEKAAADRRMSKTHVTISAGDAASAAQIYAEEASPNLILIEASESPTSLLAGLDQLAEVCDPSSHVMIIGHLNDIQLYRSLIDRGVSDYIVAPRSPLQIIEAIGKIYTDPAVSTIGRSFVFVGARGGVGSSTICHNVAWALAEEYASDTVLLDLDLPFGTASLDFERDPSQGLAEALSSPERLDSVLLDRLLQEVTKRLSIFSAPNMLERTYELSPENFEIVIDLVRQAAPSVVVDLPHIWSPWSQHVLHGADEIVITATPDLSSFRNAKNLVEVIKAHRANDAPPILLLNQMGVPKRPEVPVEQFEEALDLEALSVFPWDPAAFGQASTNAETLIELNPKSKCAVALRTVSERLLGQTQSAKKQRLSLKSLFSLGR
ncbi:pilus assembly protein CpaE [Parvularcula bermudensis HTCC2503]|uniref:Pilus assembly protein CpaE n=1 Tax=Parvularcula bermudensis (strain ATCC BAA-594 / HTCC2503 / KCTC 12087) TaxID=314260 RepID=E0TGA7_PARBH|nr:pilus assembly protein CpaE [Parvularcula bermudensis]ADM09150.1 pilus assembly protein CpaE [Parvularcula bermudensis HTCC2503]